MAVISPDRFDPLKAFCNVRLQQGVPLVDADINELDDIRAFEVRAFLKWFVGDGVPSGNDGFRIEALAAPVADDFVIRVGAQAAPVSAGAGALGPALRNAGRCIVDGIDVLIHRDTRFKEQPLFAAAALGVPQVAAVPAVAGPVLVYLDVWERTVTSAEDSSLIVPSIARESCARVKREWVVRARAGMSVPAPGNPDYSGDNRHSYYGLALIARRLVGGSPAPILPSDITDLRERGLYIPPSTFTSDVLGVDATAHRRGVGRPVMSLREAINTLLRGEQPGSSEVAFAPSPTGGNDLITRALVSDAAGGLNVFWASSRANPATALPQQIYSARVDAASLAALPTLSAQVGTTSEVAHVEPHAVALPTGDTLVVYGAPQASPALANVFWKRVPSGGSLLSAPQQPIVSAPQNADRLTPFAVVAPLPAGGGYVVFFWRQGQLGPVLFRRRRYTATWAEADAQWVAADENGTYLTGSSTLTGHRGFHAAADAAGNVWAALVTADSPRYAQAVRFTPATGADSDLPSLSDDQGRNVSSCFVLIDGTGVVWVFYDLQGGPLRLQRYTSDGQPLGESAALPLGVGPAASATSPSAVLDRQGGVWLFWTSTVSGRLWCARWSPRTRGWGPASQVTGPASSTSLQQAQTDTASAALGPNGAIWLFVQRDTAVGNAAVSNLFFRQLFTEVCGIL